MKMKTKMRTMKTSTSTTSFKLLLLFAVLRGAWWSYIGTPWERYWRSLTSLGKFNHVIMETWTRDLSREMNRQVFGAQDALRRNDTGTGQEDRALRQQEDAAEPRNEQGVCN
jgi:hypothetical protein